MRIRKGLIRVLFAAALVAGLCGLAACGSPATEISIGRNDMPRLNYVQGQELDLSAGTLTVVYDGGKIETLPLDSEKITVSGYDKDTIGKQTVTVSYGKLTTTFDVIYIARVSVENAQTVYYEGEQFDRSRGRLIIANDDATTFAVPFSDASVSFAGFDSSAPVTAQTVTATYVKDGSRYEGSFSVSVYPTDNATFTSPKRVNYFSHEEFRVNGAYITYSNGNPTYDKSIEVTADMVTGLDFSLVTAENSPMTQTATVVYGNNTFRFDVTVTFSQVTRLQNLLKEYAFEWTEPEVPEIAQTQGEQAIECAQIYFGLTPAERLYIDQTSMQAAARTAAVYAYGLWDAVATACNRTVLFRTDDFGYVLSSYDAAQSDLETLSDDENALNAYVGFFSDMTETFSDLTVGGVGMSEYLGKAAVYGENRDDILDTVDFSLRLFDTLKTVPDEWSDLTAYAAGIDAARDLIADGGFGTAGYRDFFAQISTWRTNDDFYDILYTYYLAQEDTQSIDKLKNLVLPAPLKDIYDCLLGAILEYSNIYVGTDGGYSTDSTFLVYYFRTATERKEEILAGTNELYKTLYETLAFDNILASDGQSLPSTFDDLIRFVGVTSFGYYDLVGGTLDDPALLSLWDSYLNLLLFTKEEDLSAAMKAFTEEFTSLSPARQMSFLLSLNVYYDSYEKPSLDTDVNYTYLIRMLKGYYSEILNEQEFELFRNLLLAIENYAHIGDRADAAEDFLFYLSIVTDGYGTEGENVTFREHFSTIYERYLAIAALYNEDGSLKTEPVVSDEWQAVFDALALEIENSMRAFDLIFASEESEGAFVRLFASYEAARVYAGRIESEAPDAAKEAYYRKTVKFLEKYDWTLDYAMSVQEMRIGVLGYSQLTFGGQTLWETVKDDDALRSFLGKSAGVVWGSASAADAVARMKDFLALSYRDKVLFSQLQDIDENHAYYYEGLSAIFGKEYQSDNLKAATEALLSAEQAFAEYWSYTQMEGAEEEDPEEVATALAGARTAMEALNSALAALSEEEAAQFNGSFSEILAYYQSAYEELPAE
ncbi:MAG: bacterial Ig-like domain-containing protein [Candidatus Gallimonas sp.]